MSDDYDYSDYADDHRFGKWLVLAIIILSLGALFLFLPRCFSKSVEESLVSAESSSGEGQGIQEAEVVPSDMEGVDVQKPKKLSIAATKTDGELAQIIRTNLEEGDVDQLAALVGEKVVSGETRAALVSLKKAGRLKPSSSYKMRNLGELELNRHRRWSIPLSAVGDSPTAPVLIDIKKNDEGRWSVSQLRLPLGNGSFDLSSIDSMDVSSFFLDAVRKQDLTTARTFASNKVSDVKIAALCILFEEGQYDLRERNPIKAMIRKENLGAYLATVESSQGGKSANFGLNLERKAGEAEQVWKINEINLDSLLSNYAQRMGGDDVQFTPLVKNPQGGDTLVIYFDFDSAELTPRLERQLKIVSLLLKGDSGKRIQISGHADALGSDGYNDSLSGARAKTVTQYLSSQGVNREQIITLAEGESRPLQTNETESGRRANRRTEIYLDF